LGGEERLGFLLTLCERRVWTPSFEIFSSLQRLASRWNAANAQLWSLAGSWVTATSAARATTNSTPVKTLVEQETLQIHEAAGLDLSAGQHRRNLVTSGIELEALLEATFRIGDAVFRGTRRRPPCAYLDTVAEPSGIANALTERGGICADVVEEGDIETGDRVKIVEADPRTAGNAIAERLAAKQEE
jgi:Uncharacterized protein conserved in bacteria